MCAVNNPITFPRSPGDRERKPRILGAKGLMLLMLRFVRFIAHVNFLEFVLLFSAKVSMEETLTTILETAIPEVVLHNLQGMPTETDLNCVVYSFLVVSFS